MIKKTIIICDCCGKEITEDPSADFTYTPSIPPIEDRIIGTSLVTSDSEVQTKKAICKVC